MIKKFIVLSTLVLMAVTVAVPAVAADVPEGKEVPGLTTGTAPVTTGQGLLDKLGIIGNWVFAVLITVSVIYIILAAFQFVTGGPEKAEEARKKLIFAVIGIAVALLAAGIDDVVRSIVTA